MLNLYNTIKKYFSKEENQNYQIQNPGWFTQEFLEKFKSKPKPKDSLTGYFEWAESFVK